MNIKFLAILASIGLHFSASAIEIRFENTTKETIKFSGSGKWTGHTDSENISFTLKPNESKKIDLGNLDSWLYQILIFVDIPTRKNLSFVIAHDHEGWHVEGLLTENERTLRFPVSGNLDGNKETGEHKKIVISQIKAPKLHTGKIESEMLQFDMQEKTKFEKIKRKIVG